MSKVKIKATTGGGAVSLIAPATTTANAEVQLTLPVADGSAGQTLTTNGSGELSWSSHTEAGGGKILQVIQTTKTDAYSTSSGSFTDITGMSVDITPSATSSKVYVLFSVTFGGSSNLYAGINLLRDSTTLIVNTDASGLDIPATVACMGDNANFQYKSSTANYSYLDSPNTTSAITYKLQAYAEGGKTFYVNRNEQNDNAGHNVMGTSTITVMEVEG